MKTTKMIFIVENAVKLSGNIINIWIKVLETPSIGYVSIDEYLHEVEDIGSVWK